MTQYQIPTPVTCQRYEESLPNLFIVITINHRNLIRPARYLRYYKNKGAEIHCIGSIELCYACSAILYS